ncbi:MAG: ATP-binding protein [Pseudomonadota bacterium]
MSSQANTVAARVVAGVLVTNLFVYLLAGVAMRESRSRYLHDGEVARQNIARSLTSSVSATLERIDIALSNVATQVEHSLARNTADEAFLPAYLLTQKKLVRDLQSLWVVDPEGYARWSSEPQDSTALNVADRSYFQRARREQEVRSFASEPLIGLRTGQWQILFARRINRPDGTFAGIAAGSMQMSGYFSALFSQLDLGSSGLVTIRRADMTLYARYAKGANDTSEIGTTKIAPVALEMLRAHPAGGTYIVVSPVDGVERLFAYQRDPRYPFYVFVGQDTSEILAPWRREVATVALLLLLFTLATALYSRSAYKRATQAYEAQEAERRAVAAERERLQMVLDSAPLGIAFKCQGVVRFANPRISDIFDVQVGGRLGDLYVDAADREAAAGEMEGGKPVTREMRMYDRHGSIRHMLATYVPAVFDGVQGTLGWLVDITGRKRDEEVIRRINFLSDTALALSHAGYWHAPLDGSWSFTLSPRAAEIFGLLPGPGDRQTGVEDWLDNIRAVDPASAETTRQGFLGMVENRADTFSAIHPYRRPEDGRVVWVRSYATVSRHDDPPVMYGVAQDVTDYMLAQQELARAKDAAMAATQAKSDFLANVSHEIRTPLNAIIGLAHILRRDDAAPGHERRLEQIELSGEHLLALVNDVLDLSKIEAGRLDLEDGVFRLGTVIDAAASMMQPQAAAKGLRLELEGADSPLVLRGDAMRLKQALINYLGNAVKFTAQGRVALRCRALEDSAADVLLRFEVEDTGIGIPEDRLETLFMPFLQVDASTSRKYGGTGLGLAITKHVAERMGGRVDVRSEEGKGSTFGLTVRLPKAEAGSGLLEASGDAAVAAVRAQYAGARVLLAEDNPVSAEVALDFLRHAGLVVEHAASGAEAVALATAGEFDLALMDMQMPGMDGLEATRRIRMLPAWRERPILALTANVFAQDRQRCLDAGMSEVLGKPMRPAHLYGALLKWLPARAGAGRAAATGQEAAQPGQPGQPGQPHGPDGAGTLEAFERFSLQPGISRERALDFRSRPAKYLRMVEMLLALQPTELPRIEQLLRGRELKAARALAHSVSGAAAMLGAQGVHGAAARLEAALEADADTEAEDALAGLHRSFGELAQALDAGRPDRAGE